MPREGEEEELHSLETAAALEEAEGGVEVASLEGEREHRTPDKGRVRPMT